MSSDLLFDLPPLPTTDAPERTPSRTAARPEYASYLFVISPPFHIAQEVERMKAHVEKLIGPFDARRSKAHITLCHWTVLRSDEELLRTFVQRACNRHEAFDLRFDGYDRFAHSGTLYVDPVEKAPITALADDIVHHVRGARILRVKRGGGTGSPHMTIAKQLGQEPLATAFAPFRDRPYARTMRVDRVLMLRIERPRHARVGEFLLT